MNTETLIQAIKELGPWFHQIELEGVMTRSVAPHGGPQPLNHPEPRWNRFKDVLAPDLGGIDVLDVGCNDGYFSLKALERNAKSVLGLDVDEGFVKRANFVKKVRKASNARFAKGDVYDLHKSVKRTCPLAFFLAVLYHLKSPHRALMSLARCADHVILESIAIADKVNPLLYWGPETGIVFDGMVPTHAAITTMLDDAGFKHVAEIDAPAAGDLQWAERPLAARDIEKSSVYRPIFIAGKTGLDPALFRLR